MQLLSCILLAFLLLLSPTAWAQSVRKQAPLKLENLRLVDVTGAVHEPVKSAKTVAVVFVYVDTTCPIANFYQPTPAPPGPDLRGKGHTLLPDPS